MKTLNSWLILFVSIISLFACNSEEIINQTNPQLHVLGHTVGNTNSDGVVLWNAEKTVDMSATATGLDIKFGYYHNQDIYIGGSYKYRKNQQLITAINSTESNAMVVAYKVFQNQLSYFYRSMPSGFTRPNFYLQEGNNTVLIASNNQGAVHNLADITKLDNEYFAVGTQGINGVVKSVMLRIAGGTQQSISLSEDDSFSPRYIYANKTKLYIVGAYFEANSKLYIAVLKLNPDGSGKEIIKLAEVNTQSNYGSQSPMIFEGDDFYLSGMNNGKACYWKNNAEGLQYFSNVNGSIANSLVKYGNDVYGVGYENGASTCWKNASTYAKLNMNGKDIQPLHIFIK